MNIVLYQPDIPQNTGSLLRLCACLGLDLHIIEPCGFPLDDRKMARVAMDYGAQARVTRHAGFNHFLDIRRAAPDARLILLTRRAERRYTDFSYRHGDFLLLGRESSGVPPEIRKACDMEVAVPMQPAARSLNVTLAAAMVAGEALRQTAWAEEAARDIKRKNSI